MARIAYHQFDNEKKIMTKANLERSLKSHQNLLSVSMIEYLQALIELEYSVVSDNISEQDRQLLSNFKLYHQIAQYNIYHRALKILGDKRKFSLVRDSIGARFYSATDKSQLFEFIYNARQSWTTTVPKIGTITIHQTLMDEKLREAELEKVISVLDNLYRAENPYEKNFCEGEIRIGGPRATWFFEHAKKVAEYENIWRQLEARKVLTEYENIWRQLEARKVLTDAEKREIDITKEVCDLMLKDYGLTEANWEEQPQSPHLHKILAKKMPELIIQRDIKIL